MLCPAITNPAVARSAKAADRTHGKRSRRCSRHQLTSRTKIAPTTDITRPSPHAGWTSRSGPCADFSGDHVLHGAEDRGADSMQRDGRGNDCRPGGLLRATHEDCTVGRRRDRRSVRTRQQRRGVDEDDVVMPAQLVEHIPQPRSRQDRAGVAEAVGRREARRRHHPPRAEPHP